MEALCQAPWPGNVRQLENVIERLSSPARRESHRTGGSAVGSADARQWPASRPASGAARSPTSCSRNWCEERQSFWTAVYPLYMNREITRAQRARPGAQGARRSARQLQDRARSCSTSNRASTNAFSISCGSTTANCHSRNTDSRKPGIGKRSGSRTSVRRVLPSSYCL